MDLFTSGALLFYMNAEAANPGGACRLYYSSLSAATSKRLVAAAMAREVSLLFIIFFVLIIKLLSFGELQRGAFGNHQNSLPKSPFFSGAGWESAEMNS